MGLDKWLQSEKDEKKEPKSKKKDRGESRTQISKFMLICTNSKCKYQKVLMKKLLMDKDTICPKCKSKMKFKG